MLRKACFLAIFVILLHSAIVSAQSPAPSAPFNGLDVNLGNLTRISNAETHSISPENFTG
jgi:hypothetical protein